MSRKTASARAGSDRANLYDEITDKIVAELEAGRVPWVQPWGTAAVKAPLAMPRNAATGRQYSGINVLILWGAVIEHGYAAQTWLTFRQALALGGNVRKGEHGTTVVYADRFVPDDEKRRARETGEEAQAIPFLKRFTVFNAAQCENLADDVAVAAPPPPPGLIEPRVEALIRATGIDFRIGGNRAFYAPGPDFVMVPPPQAYFEPINWHTNWGMPQVTPRESAATCPARMARRNTRSKNWSPYPDSVILSQNQAWGGIIGGPVRLFRRPGQAFPQRKRGQRLTRRRLHKLVHGVQAKSCTPATRRAGEREGNPSHSKQRSCAEGAPFRYRACSCILPILALFRARFPLMVSQRTLLPARSTSPSAPG